MKYIDNSKNYQRLFHFEGTPFLFNELWMEFYKDLDAMITAIDDEWYSWLPKESLEAQLDEGVEFFADIEKFEKYYTEHKSFLDEIQNVFQEEILDKSTLNEQSVRRFVELFPKALSLYYKTEFFYTDKAYKLSEQNPGIQDNLMKHYALKEEARILIFNDLWFKGDSFFNVLFDKLAVQFEVSVADLPQYSVKDIYDLFAGSRPQDDVLQKRKEGRIIRAENGETVTYIGSEVREEIENLLKQTGEVAPESVDQLKGVPASKGRVTGRVKIVVSDPLTFDSLATEMDKMKQGDILVAETTSPEFMPACKKAAAIIANQGGLLSHAAVISREFGIPCVVGLRYATEVFKDGDLVEVDADNGIVRKL